MIHTRVTRSICAFLLLAAIAVGMPHGAVAKTVAATTAPAAVYGKVTKITSTVIYLKGNYLNRVGMTWQVSTTNKTKYYNVKNKLMKRTSIRVGDRLTATGYLVNHTYRIINVSEIDDWSR